MPSLRVTSGDAYGIDGSNDRRLRVAVTKVGVAVDLTGVDLTFMVKRVRFDSDADALFSKTIGSGITLATQSGATTGVAYITLTEANTASLAGKYHWELEADDAVGKITLASGSFYVSADMIVGA